MIRQSAPAGKAAHSCAGPAFHVEHRVRGGPVPRPEPRVTDQSRRRGRRAVPRGNIRGELRPGNAPAPARSGPRTIPDAFALHTTPPPHFPRWSRVLCLGMSALDAIYRVPAIPLRADQGAGHRVHRMRRRHGGQRQRRRRPARAAPHITGAASATTRWAADHWPSSRPKASTSTTVRRIRGLRFAVGRHPGRRRRRAPGLRLQRPAARPRPVMAAARAGSPAFGASSPTSVGRPARPSVLDAARAAGLPASSTPTSVLAEATRDLARRATHVAFSGAGSRARRRDRRARRGLAPDGGADVDGMVGVTLGRRGLICGWTASREQRIAAPAITAVDTLAAGDIWHGAFTLALGGRTGSIESAARFANIAAAIKCTRFGGRRGSADARRSGDALPSSAITNRLYSRSAVRTRLRRQNARRNRGSRALRATRLTSPRLRRAEARAERWRSAASAGGLCAQLREQLVVRGELAPHAPQSTFITCAKRVRGKSRPVQSRSP